MLVDSVLKILTFEVTDVFIEIIYSTFPSHLQ